MHLILLDANPNIAIGGQIAAIIICIFLLISVILMVAVNLGLAFLLSWIREKTNAIKLLRPTVDSVNKSSKAALEGKQIDASENAVVRTVATLPGSVRTIDQKVDQISDKVASATIEFRARTVQVQTIVKTFLMPGASRKAIPQPGNVGKLPVPGTDSSKMVEEVEIAEEQIIPVADQATRSDGSKPASTARQRQHVSAH
jgi:uncharacterized membrane protein